MIYTVIKEMCSKKKMSITELEKKAGLGNGSISKWNDSSPTLKNLESVANVLGVKVETILKRRDSEV